jgi:hypothetical protein
MDGQPNPDCGPFFVSVHPINKQPGETVIDHGVCLSFGIGITITIRSADTPYSKNFDEIFLASMIGFDKYEDRIVNAVHKNTVLMAAANTLITSSTYKFITPLEWQGSEQPPVTRDASWFFGDRPQDYSKNREAGFSQTIQFGNAQILRCFD